MLFIQNAHIKPMSGPDLENGCLLIENGRIAAIGTNLTAPEGATVIDAQGRLVTPGLVEAHCHIGLHNEAVGFEGRDYNEIVDPVTPQLRAIDSINPQDEAFRLAIEAGVTTAVTGPGSANVVGGTFAAIKLHGVRVDNMIVKSPAAVLRELLFRAKRYQEDQENGKNPAFDMKLESMLPVLRGEIPLKAHAHRADDIFTSIRIAKEFGVGITLDHCTDGSIIADELAKEGLPAFVGPSLGGKSKIELINKSFSTPADLHAAGVPISIITDAPVVPLQYLPLCAGLAIRSGLDEETAWHAITINPATYTGIGDRVGSLDIGKDADVVLWNGNPLTDIAAGPAMTIVNGEIVYEA